MTIFSRLAAALMAALIVGTSPAYAEDGAQRIKVGALVLSDIWARTTPPTAKTGAAYFRIDNPSGEADVLTGAQTTISARTEIHRTSMQGGIMKMQHVGRVPIAAGGSTELAPGGFHIMFIGLHAPIRDGDRIPLTLTFENAGQVEVMVTARKATGKTGMNHGTMTKGGDADMAKPAQP